MNRVVMKTTEGGKVTEYFYDNTGNRFIKKGPEGTTLYLRHGQTSVAMDIELGQAGIKGKINRYVLSGELLAGRITKTVKIDGSISYDFSYYHLDHLNSTKCVSDEAGVVEVRYVYRAFGSQLAKIGSGEAKYTYSGKELDDENGLYYFNARYYDAEIGRFISVDPAKDGLNWYSYCNNNPLRFKDPTGLDAIYCNDSSRANNFGHAFIIIINKDGSGTLYSFGPTGKKVSNAPGKVTKVEYTVKEMKNSETLKNALVQKGKNESIGIQGGADNIKGVKDITTLEIHIDEKSTELIRQFCEKSLVTTPKYDLKKYNCADYTADAFKAGGITIPRHGVFGDSYSIPDRQCKSLSQDKYEYDGMNNNEKF